MRLLLLGVWGPSTSVRSLTRRLSDVEERLDYQQKQIQRLRGHVTGGIRYDEAGAEIPEGDGTFPEEEFQRLLTERRGGVSYARDQTRDDSDDLPGL